MKRIFTLIIASFVVSVMYAQQPLNPSFENWSAATTGELPDGWDGTNVNVTIATIEGVTKDDTDPQEGTYSAKLETKYQNIFGNDVFVPGIITLGKLNFTEQTLTGGMEYTERPDQFTGWYKYSPVNGDTAEIGIAFYHGEDTICVASIEITAEVTTWTEFTLDLVYLGGASPDTMNIICAATNNDDLEHEGSILNVDNFKLSGGTLGITQNLMSEKAFSISPNPANTFVNINVPNVNNDVKIVLHNTVGQVVYSNTFNNVNEVKERIDISEFNSGIYFVEIINGNKSSIEKLVIK